MCFVSTPKVNTNPAPVEFLHNQFLDNVGPDGTGASQGRNSLVVGTTNTDLNAPTVTTGGTAGVQTATPRAVGGLAPNPVAAGSAARTVTPGMVTPTVGGSLAGAVPAYMTIGGK